MLLLDTVFVITLYCIRFNGIKYMSLLSIVFSLRPAVPYDGISTVLAFTVLDYSCRGVHSQRVPFLFCFFVGGGLGGEQ